jgi:hypothetical protein
MNIHEQQQDLDFTLSNKEIRSCSWKFSDTTVKDNSHTYKASHTSSPGWLPIFFTPSFFLKKNFKHVSLC